jgi:hypothetical protein
MRGSAAKEKRLSCHKVVFRRMWRSVMLSDKTKDKTKTILPWSGLSPYEEVRRKTKQKAPLFFAEQGFCRIAMSHYDITVFR